MKTAVVTGASRGIGKAIAKCFARQNHRLIVCARNKEQLETLTQELNQISNLNHLFFAADFSTKEEVKQFARFVRENTQSVDALINNAGVFVPSSILNENDEIYENEMRVNVDSAYYLTKELIPLLQESKSASIFNICSVASLKAYPAGGSYSISKFALLGLTKAFREALKDKNIKVTAVLPGATFTSSWEGIDIEEERFMPTEDIAKSIFDVYSLSDRTVVEEIILRPQLGDI